MAIKTTSKMLCDQCGKQILPTGGSGQSIHIRESKICGSKGIRTLNGDFCNRDCFLKEIEDAGCY